MACNRNRRSRHFELTQEQINAILFAESSDSECDDLDNEDVQFLEDDIQDLDIGENEKTLVIIDGAKVKRPNETNNEEIDKVPEDDNYAELPKYRKRKGNMEKGKGKKIKKEKSKIVWSNKIGPIVLPQPDIEVEWGKIKLQSLSDNTSEADIFAKVANIKYLVEEIIVPQTNLYAQQKGELFETSSEEIYAFLGICYIMGYHILPTFRDYWATDEDLSVPLIARTMTYERFAAIRRYLHFNDNEKNIPIDDANRDRAFKIRPIIEHFNKAFQDAVEPEECMSIDEHMIKFRGRNIMRQYIKNKPIRWGFKIWARCGSKNGYLYEFDMYTGKKKETEYGLGASVVLQLSEKLEGTCAKLYFDNFFTSSELLKLLKEKKIFACGTVRCDRKDLPTDLKKDKEMERGEIDCRQADGIYVVKWMDNRSVLLLTTISRPDNIITVERREKGKAEKKKVTCPTVIQEYNNFMGGVDIMDQKKCSYGIDRGSKIKYYLRPFHDLLDIAVNNAYVVYQKLNPSSKLKSITFRRNIALSLIGDYSSRKHSIHSFLNRHRASQIYANEDKSKRHLPDISETRKRCKNCSEKKRENRTNIICTQCNMHFCLTNNRNCFKEFHKK
jgi:hypothetical protein